MIEIAAGQTARRTVQVQRDSVLVYSMQASDFLSLKVHYASASAKSSSGASSRWVRDVPSTTLLAKQSGEVVFEFGNQSAWFKTVSVVFSCEVVHPLQPGLERPYCVLLSSPTEAGGDDLVLDCTGLNTKDIQASGRRFWGFSTEHECRSRTGRKIDFKSVADLVSGLKQNNEEDLHPYLAPMAASSSSSSSSQQSSQQQQQQQLQLVLGTFIFESLPLEVCQEMLSMYLARGGDGGGGELEIDTGRSYGKSEEIVGRLLLQQQTPSPKVAVAISTKVNPFPYSGRALDAANIQRQVRESTAALQLSSSSQIKILYLHQPDSKTALEVTLAEMNLLHQQGAFAELGLSNYSAWQVVYIYHLCSTRGWVRPTVYQGVYNCLARGVEPELLPALAALNIRFLCYNPLAGGLLTGRYSGDLLALKASTSGRFAQGSAIGARYVERYGHESTLEAVRVLAKACEQCDVGSMTDMAFRWLVCHSGLKPQRGDGIVLGASTVQHLEENLRAVDKAKPLPQLVLNAVDKAWAQLARHHAPPYFRE